MIVADLLPLAVRLERLHCLPGNPRRGDVDAIARSLERFGQHRPVVARRTGTDDAGNPTGEVIAGNHTLLAAHRLGWEELAVVWVDDDDATAAGRALADNRTAELGSYDDAALADLLATVADDADLLAATSYDPGDLEALLESLSTAAEFVPVEGPGTRLDERAPVTCPKCGEVFHVQR